MKKISILFTTYLLSLSLYAQTHKVEIHPNNRVASLQMEPTEYLNWKQNNEFESGEVRESLFKDIYQTFEDDYDFIFLILNEEEKPSNLPFGQLVPVSNDVLGIGASIYDWSERYGSKGRLKSVIHLTKRTYLRSGPSLHELAHNWGNRAIPTENVRSAGTNLTSFAYQPHWGFTGGSTKGQLGGFEQATLVDNGNDSYTMDRFGTFANGGNSQPYNELELYLMGMIPLVEVSDFDVFTDITSLIINESTLDIEAQRTTYTQESLENLLGERSPSSTTSQKDFNALIVVLTDTPLTAAQWDIVDQDAERFSRTSSDDSSSFNFWEATNQLGTIDFNIKRVLGVEQDHLSSQLKVYPNPAKDHITLRITGNETRIKDFSLFSTLGKEIEGLEILKKENSFEINVEGLKPGTYLLYVKDSNGRKMMKKVLIR